MRECRHPSLSSTPNTCQLLENDKNAKSKSEMKKSNNKWLDDYDAPVF